MYGGGFSERNSMEARFNNEVAILNFLYEHVFTNEVAILNGRKFWFRESKVEIEQLECSGKYFVSSSKQSLSISISFGFKHTTQFFSTVPNAGWQKVQQSFKFESFWTENCIQYIRHFLELVLRKQKGY